MNGDDIISSSKKTKSKMAFGSIIIPCISVSNVRSVHVASIVYIYIAVYHDCTFVRKNTVSSYVAALRNLYE